MSELRKSDYNYNLPEELIAQVPASKRDESRLMVLDRNSGEISHRIFHDIKDYLKKGESIIFDKEKIIYGK